MSFLAVVFADAVACWTWIVPVCGTTGRRGLCCVCTIPTCISYAWPRGGPGIFTGLHDSWYCVMYTLYGVWSALVPVRVYQVKLCMFMD